MSHQTARAGQPLVAFPNSDTDEALDFVALHPGTSAVSGTELMLRWCNGSAWQTFTAKQVGDTSSYEWVKAATGDRRPATATGQ